MTLRVLKGFLRFILVLIVLSYFVVAGLLLVTKYWVMPRIDSWRPTIESSLSEALGSKVVLDKVKAEWSGLSPAFELDGLTVFDSQEHEALVVPRIRANFSWRSVLALEPSFSYIGIEGLALAIQRSSDGVIRIAGFDIDPVSEQDASSGTHETDPVWHREEPFRWLLSQRRIDLNDALIVWIDQKRDAAPLEISGFSLSLRNSLLSHRFEGEFGISSAPGQKVEFAMTSDRLGGESDLVGGEEIDGELFVELSDIEPASLTPWVDLPEMTGRYSVRSWLALEQGKIANVTLEAAGTNVGTGVAAAETTSWTGDFVKLRLDGPLGMFLPVSEHSAYISEIGAGDPVTLRFDGQGLTIDPPSDVMASIRFEDLRARTRIQQSPQGDLSLALEDVSARTPDGLVSLRGSWNKRHDSEAGDLNLQGSLAQFNAARLYHYMPAEVGEDVIDWMRKAFTAGSIPKAAFVVRGPLSEFPFEGESKGVFTIDGSVQNLTIDYAPAEVDSKDLGWPALVGLNGKLSLNRDVLTASIQSGALAVTPDTQVDVIRLEATMENLFSNPVLNVQTRTRSEAQGYQKALTDTALASIVPGMVRDLKGTGDWTLNLDLGVPLADVDDITFKAALDLHGGTLQYADLPALESVTGQAVFTGSGFSSNHLQAKVLGSDLRVSGAFGEPDSTLTVQGQLAMQPLNNHFKVPSLNQWIKGSLPFELTVTQPVADGPIRIALDSSMKGLQLLFPAPLTLASGTSLNTRVQWEIDPNSSSVGSGSLQMGNLLQVNASGRTGSQGATLSSVAIGIGAAPTASKDSLTVNIAADTLDATAWMAVQESLMKDFGTSSSSSQPFMPALGSVQLVTKQAKWDDTQLDDVKAIMQVSGDRYAVDFSSIQTNGVLNWQMNDGEFVGRLQARLSRLELGTDRPEDATVKAATAKQERAAPALPDEATLSTIPPVDVVIDDLVLHSMKLGRLELIGQNSSGNRVWNIEKLTLTGPAASLSASGQWRFVQSNPGINADLDLDIKDMGEFLSALGHPGQIRRGKGTVKAQIDWQNFPWFLGYEGLQGKAQINLTEGIFDHVNSESARVLELLSLQSFNRILDMNVNRGETFAKGFPWSSIRGNLDINKGEINTTDLLIDSPVATIAFNGGANLVSEQLNMRATVRPNLDMSGTAMATGFLLNPVIGLGALVGNYLLRTPLESALSLRYEVTGPLSDPQLKEVGATEEPLPESVRERQEKALKESGEQNTDTVDTPVAGTQDAPGDSTTSSSSDTSGNGLQQGGGSAPSTESPGEPTPRVEREVYRIELGKDSGFDPKTRGGIQGEAQAQQPAQ